MADNNNNAAAAANDNDNNAFQDAQQDVQPAPLFPGEHVGGQMLDFNQKLHYKHWENSIKSLYPDSKDRFDLKKEGLLNFLNNLKTRDETAMMSTLEVPVAIGANNQVDMNGEWVHMCTGHARFTRDHITAFVRSFANQRNRARQDDIMLYQCVYNSLSEDAKDKVNEKDGNFKLGEHTSGVLLLFEVIQRTGLDAYIDPDTIRQEISQLPMKFQQLEFNVKDLHSWVRTKLKELRRSGSNQHVDLRAHLVQAYRIAPDDRFRNYMQRKIDDFKGAEALNAEQLMSKADDQVNQIEKDNALAALKGENPTPAPGELLAQQAKLHAKIASLENERKSNKSNQQSNPKGNGKPKGGGGGKDNDKEQKKQPFPAELKNAKPPSDASKPRKINGKKYYYCTYHQKWGEHPTSDCKAKKNAAQEASGGEQKSNTKAQERTIRAFSAVVDQHNGYDSSSSSE